MAQFAAVDFGMDLVGEDDVRHAEDRRFDVEILRVGDRLPFDRNALDLVLQLDHAFFLGLHPVHAVAEPGRRKILEILVEIILELHFLAVGMAPFAVLHLAHELLAAKWRRMPPCRYGRSRSRGGSGCRLP